MLPIPKTVNPLYVPTDISRAPKPRTDRPARQQITELPKESQDNVVGEYNIWYHRHLGYDQKQAKPETRINVQEDTGLTTAGPDATICLNFCRGNCIKGYKCRYKHQIPTEDDELRVSMLKDVFGRGRHGTDKEEMDGTGNFNRNNRTLYLGAVVSKDDVRESEKLVKADFSQFGELEYVRVIPSKAIGFVRFKLRVAAEFAREAMNGQTTPYGEISCKWAHVDPNPLAKEFDKRADEALAQYAIAKRIMEMSADKRESWKVMQQVQNGVYPTQAPPPVPAALPPVPLPPPGGQVQPPPGMEGGPGGLPPLPAVPAPPGVDPARASQFAEYWANFHAQKTSEALGIEAPKPEIPAPGAPVATPPPAATEAPPASGFTNPHTGETVSEAYAVNPYSQAPHPYAYRDYGWNRPKKKSSEAEKEKRRGKRTALEALEKDDYDAQQDPNFSYGPAGNRKERRARQNSNNNGGGGRNAITPGVPSAQAAYPTNQPILIPAARGKVAQATLEEAEALDNDEPLLFN